MEEDMRALEKNSHEKQSTFLKIKKKFVGCKWVFTVKYKTDGIVERYKVEVVAKGYTQLYGIDYQETFAPLAKMNLVRVLISFVTTQ